MEMAGKVQSVSVPEKQPDLASIVTQQPATKLRRKKVVIEITANETQYAYLNEVLMKLKNNAEKVEILKKEEL